MNFNGIYTLPIYKVESSMGPWNVPLRLLYRFCGIIERVKTVSLFLCVYLYLHVECRAL